MALIKEWLGAFLNRIKDPSNRKRVWAIVGATIILGTFLVKDVMRDNLKDLVDSIDAAENTYLIRTETRRNYDEIQQFEKEFAEFRENPTTPVPRRLFSEGGGGGDTFITGDGEFDWDAFYRTTENQKANNELLDNVIRLANKLPGGPGKKELVDADKQNRRFTVEMRDIEVIYRDLERSSKEHIHDIDELNQRVYDHAIQLDEISTTTNKLSFIILQNAETERSKDEFLFAISTWMFYFLYLAGWMISVAGILMGQGDEKKDDVLKATTDL